MQESDMRASSILGKTIAVLVLTTASASAAAPTAYKSNMSFKIRTAPRTTEADCREKGGTVTTDKDGVKSCAIAGRAWTRCLVYQPGHQGDDRYCSQGI